jgi:ATP-dependent DNA helicase Rep
MVIAGAGSGKTRVITHKIQHLVASGFTPSSIAAITFTNKAALEMQERLKGLGGISRPKSDAFGAGLEATSDKDDSNKNSPLVCTFHSLGVRILRTHGTSLGLKKQFSILDSDDVNGIVQSALATTDRKLIRACISNISLWKNNLVDPDQAVALAKKDQESQFARVYREYHATLKAYQAVDFDDLIGLPVKLFQADLSALQYWRERLRYLLVDEYQDTNACQYELLKLIVGPRQAFTAVGDDDQSIYGWRGATLENLKRLSVDFPTLQVIKLEQNYRSCQAILHAANALIELNPKLYPKTLWSELGPGDPITVVQADDDEVETRLVIQRLQARKFELRAKYSDFAVLYRGNHQARIFEKALRLEKIPYILSGGQSFFDRSEIRDLMAYLRLLVNNEDDPALIRAITTPKRGVGNQTLQALGQYAAERQCSMFEAMFEAGFENRVQPRQLEAMRTFGAFVNRMHERARKEPAAELFNELLKAIDYEAHLMDQSDDKTALTRWQNVLDFVDWIKKRAESDQAAGGSADSQSLMTVAQDLALLSQLDKKDTDQDAVRLSTIHAAKGLEYPHVFIVGCEEGILPHHREADFVSEEVVAGKDTAEAGASEAGFAGRIEEERRLMYVAVTRAQRTLTLSWCKERKRVRDSQRQQVSRFVGEMKLSASTASAKPLAQDAAKAKLDLLKGMLAQRSVAKPDRLS